MEAPKNAALRSAIEILGSQRALADALGITPVAVGQWLQEGCNKNARRVPPKQCVRIERLTNGVVSRRDLRPDDWQDFWPDPVISEPKQAQALTRQAPAATESVARCC